jgi:hypothetical protein
MVAAFCSASAMHLVRVQFTRDCYFIKACCTIAALVDPAQLHRSTAASLLLLLAAMLAAIVGCCAHLVSSGVHTMLLRIIWRVALTIGS